MSGRLILPGQQRPAVAGSVDEAALPNRPTMLHPGQIVPAMLAAGAEIRTTTGHKPGRVLLALSIGPIGIPLEMSPEQARTLLSQFQAAIDAADPPPGVLPFIPAGAAVDAPTDGPDPQLTVVG